MAKFVDIGKYHVNVDYVVSVTPPITDMPTIWIEMINGQQIEVDRVYYEKLLSHAD